MAALKAGVIGLGTIGGGVAVCLARAGRPLAVYDVRSDAAEGRPGVPAPLASPAEVARDADVVLIAVVDAAQTRDVLEGPNGVLVAARPGLTVVTLSTLALPELRELFALCEAAGVELVDCGVTGGPLAAEKGLVCMVGGTDETVERIRPVLDDCAKLVLHCGPPGAGMAAKIARNILPYAIWRATYEAGLLAERAGVDLRILAQAIEESPFPKGVTTINLMRGTVAPLPPEEQARRRQRGGNLLLKDLGAAKALADELGIELPLAELTRLRWEEVQGLDASK